MADDGSGDGTCAYHDGDEHEEGDGPVFAEEGVGEEGGEERHDGGRALPVGNTVGGGLAVLVQPVTEEVHKVRRDAEVGGALEAAVHCIGKTLVLSQNVGSVVKKNGHGWLPKMKTPAQKAWRSLFDEFR